MTGRGKKGAKPPSEALRKDEPPLFLSYSSKDALAAIALEAALATNVWRDQRSIQPGEEWEPAIEDGLRSARAVILIVSAHSAASPWVTYEYAFAIGAGIPVVALALEDIAQPAPLRRYQWVPFAEALERPERIKAALERQHAAREAKVRIFARFREQGGQVVRNTKGKWPELAIEVWIEGAPRTTKAVSFEIDDVGVEDRQWRVPRGRAHREFLTDDVSLYGDVWLSAVGFEAAARIWRTESRLYEALLRYYEDHDPGGSARDALRQIRAN